MMFSMRTTVTLDPDTENLLRAEVRRTGHSFKEILNRSIRRSLLPVSQAASRVGITALFPAAFPAEFSEAGFNRLADELDDKTTLDELGA
jgi:hypothetical protein